MLKNLRPRKAFRPLLVSTLAVAALAMATTFYPASRADATPTYTACATLAGLPVESAFEVNSELDPTEGSFAFEFVGAGVDTEFTISLSDSACYTHPDIGPFLAYRLAEYVQDQATTCSDLQDRMFDTVVIVRNLEVSPEILLDYLQKWCVVNGAGDRTGCIFGICPKSEDLLVELRRVALANAQ